MNICRTQRKNYKEGNLSEKREILLNKINFSWESYKESQWNQKFNELKNSLKKDPEFKLNMILKCMSGYEDKKNY